MKLKDQSKQSAPEKPDIKEFVTVEDTSNNLKTLKISVPAKVVQIEYQRALNTIATHSALPGFRKGRVPHRLIERRLGDAIRNETKLNLINNMTTEAIEVFEIKTLGDPRVTTNVEEVEVKDGEPVNFEVEVEVMPEFDLPDFSDLEIMRPEVDYPETIIDDEIEKLRINEGSLEERDEPEAGDYLTGLGIMTDPEGTEHYNIDGAVVRVPEDSDEGKGMILGIAVDDFAKQLGSPKVGETATIKVTGPAQHEIEAIRGKELAVTFEVQRIDRIVPAELADVVAKLGLAGEGQLREIIEQRLAENAKTQQQAAVQAQIAKYMIDNTEFELSEKMTEGQIERNLERRRMELMYRGVDPQEIEQNMAEMRAASAAEAVRELRLFFIYGRVAESFDISVSNAEIGEHITTMAAQRGVTPDAMRQQIMQADKLNVIRGQVREHKVIEAISDKATIKDVSADEYNEYVRGLQEASEG